MTKTILFLCIVCITSISVASGFGIFSTQNGSPISRTTHTQRKLQVHQGGPLYASSQSEQPQTPLIDLQTFLKLAGAVDTGGKAKAAIQGGECYLNGEVETRRAKKLFKGDEVFFNEKAFDVLDMVNLKGYVFKTKDKKVKPVAKIDAAGNLEFGGRFRSPEWRAERKEKKAAAKREAGMKKKED